MMLLRYRGLDMWHWRFARRVASDPEVRAASLDPKPPTFWAHARWMWYWSGQPACWVIEQGQWVETITARYTPVGIVRASRLPGGGAEVSIALLGEARGQGIGSRALRDLAPFIAEIYGGPVFAQIKAENLASVNAFQKAGYTVAGARDWQRVTGGRGGILVLEWNRQEQEAKA